MMMREYKGSDATARAKYFGKQLYARTVIIYIYIYTFTFILLDQLKKWSGGNFVPIFR